MGVYGFFRITLNLFPIGSIYFTPLIYLFCIIGILYCSCTTIRQIDFKKVIAYSSVCHMGYIILGLFSNSIEGIVGALVLVVSHGLVSSSLFFIFGFLYDRYHTRLIRYYSGLMTTMPVFSAFLLILLFFNMSFPGTLNFIGEFLVLIGLVNINFMSLILGLLGVVFSAIYSI